MNRRNALGKFKDTAIDTLKGPVAATAERVVGKAIVQAKGTVGLGKVLAGQVTKSVVSRASRATTRTTGRTAPSRAPESRTPAPTPTPKAAAAASKEGRVPEVSPADVAKVVAKKASVRKPGPSKPASRKPAPTKKSAPGAKLPPRKATPPPAPTPLIDPATTKKVAAEADVLGRASDVDKG
ncbi:hypothetical protein [Nocardioides sp.]|uniref:hypothetical protein n=1 Tax=Nocardioides sp. TaxID=35761 RepID=UPI0031FF213A|nr:hypothetical protein [Nocardioides sp.]